MLAAASRVRMVISQQCASGRCQGMPRCRAGSFALVRVSWQNTWPQNIAEEQPVEASLLVAMLLNNMLRISRPPRIPPLRSIPLPQPCRSIQ